VPVSWEFENQSVQIFALYSPYTCRHEWRARINNANANVGQDLRPMLESAT